MKGFVLFAAFCITAAAQAESWKFDMGTAQSPLQAGYQRVDKITVYDAKRGFGWTQPCDEDFVRTGAKYLNANPAAPGAELMAPASDLLLDGVASAKPMTFRIDLPNKKYWVMAYVGDLEKPVGIMGLDANGKTVTERIPQFAPGVSWVRFSSTVENGKLEVALRHTTAGFKDGSIARNALLGLEIYPCTDFEERPFFLYKGQLETSVQGGGKISRPFNDKAYGEIQAALAKSTAKAKFPLTFASAYLWLAGRPEVANGKELVAQAQSILADFLKANPDNWVAVDLSTSAWLYSTAMKLGGMNEVKPDQKTAGLAWDLLRQIPESDPLYPNAQAAFVKP